MKLLITGATGFIGKNLVELYRDRYDIISPSRKDDLSKVLENERPDKIINSAAEIYNADVMFDSNIILTLKCLEYLQKNPSAKMIQIGSSAEYGPLNHPSSENDKINPVDMYQATKGSATLLCQGYARFYKLDITIARPYSVYGIYEKPHRLFPRLYRNFFKNEELVLYEGVHDFIYIDDFLRGIDTMLENKLELGEIINFGSGIQYTNAQVLELWEKVTGIKPNVKYNNYFNKMYENDIWCCDTGYAKKVINFSTQFDLESGIKHFIEKCHQKGIY